MESDKTEHNVVAENTENSTGDTPQSPVGDGSAGSPNETTGKTDEIVKPENQVKSEEPVPDNSNHQADVEVGNNAGNPANNDSVDPGKDEHCKSEDVGPESDKLADVQTVDQPKHVDNGYSAESKQPEVVVKEELQHTEKDSNTENIQKTEDALNDETTKTQQTIDDASLNESETVCVELDNKIVEKMVGKDESEKDDKEHNTPAVVEDDKNESNTNDSEVNNLPESNENAGEAKIEGDQASTPAESQDITVDKTTTLSEQTDTSEETPSDTQKEVVQSEVIVTTNTKEDDETPTEVEGNDIGSDQATTTGEKTGDSEPNEDEQSKSQINIGDVVEKLEDTEQNGEAVVSMEKEQSSEGEATAQAPDEQNGETEIPEPTKTNEEGTDQVDEVTTTSAAAKQESSGALGSFEAKEENVQDRDGNTTETEVKGETVGDKEQTSIDGGTLVKSKDQGGPLTTEAKEQNVEATEQTGESEGTTATDTTGEAQGDGTTTSGEEQTSEAEILTTPGQNKEQTQQLIETQEEGKCIETGVSEQTGEAESPKVADVEEGTTDVKSEPTVETNADSSPESIVTEPIKNEGQGADDEASAATTTGEVEQTCQDESNEGAVETQEESNEAAAPEVTGEVEGTAIAVEAKELIGDSEGSATTTETKTDIGGAENEDTTMTVVETKEQASEDQPTPTETERTDETANTDDETKRNNEVDGTAPEGKQQTGNIEPTQAADDAQQHREATATEVEDTAPTAGGGETVTSEGLEQPEEDKGSDQIESVVEGTETKEETVGTSEATGQGITNEVNKQTSDVEPMPAEVEVNVQKAEAEAIPTETKDEVKEAGIGAVDAKEQNVDLGSEDVEGIATETENKTSEGVEQTAEVEQTGEGGSTTTVDPTKEETVQDQTMTSETKGKEQTMEAEVTEQSDEGENTTMPSSAEEQTSENQPHETSTTVEEQLVEDKGGSDGTVVTGSSEEQTSENQLDGRSTTVQEDKEQPAKDKVESDGEATTAEVKSETDHNQPVSSTAGEELADKSNAVEQSGESTTTELDGDGSVTVPAAQQQTVEAESTGVENHDQALSIGEAAPQIVETTATETGIGTKEQNDQCESSVSANEASRETGQVESEDTTTTVEMKDDSDQDQGTPAEAKEETAEENATEPTNGGVEAIITDTKGETVEEQLTEVGGEAQTSENTCSSAAIDDKEQTVGGDATKPTEVEGTTATIEASVHENTTTAEEHKEQTNVGEVSVSEEEGQNAEIKEQNDENEDLGAIQKSEQLPGEEEGPKTDGGEETGKQVTEEETIEAGCSALEETEDLSDESVSLTTVDKIVEDEPVRTEDEGGKQTSENEPQEAKTMQSDIIEHSIAKTGTAESEVGAITEPYEGDTSEARSEVADSGSSESGRQIVETDTSSKETEVTNEASAVEATKTVIGSQETLSEKDTEETEVAQVTYETIEATDEQSSSGPSIEKQVNDIEVSSNTETQEKPEGETFTVKSAGEKESSEECRVIAAIPAATEYIARKYDEEESATQEAKFDVVGLENLATKEKVSAVVEELSASINTKETSTVEGVEHVDICAGETTSIEYVSKDEAVCGDDTTITEPLDEGRGEKETTTSEDASTKQETEAKEESNFSKGTGEDDTETKVADESEPVVQSLTSFEEPGQQHGNNDDDDKIKSTQETSEAGKRAVGGEQLVEDMEVEDFNLEQEDWAEKSLQSGPKDEVYPEPVYTSYSENVSEPDAAKDEQVDAKAVVNAAVKEEMGKPKTTNDSLAVCGTAVSMRPSWTQLHVNNMEQRFEEKPDPLPQMASAVDDPRKGSLATEEEHVLVNHDPDHVDDDYYEEDFCFESDHEEETTEKQTSEVELKNDHENEVAPEPEVVEISLEFLEMLEGFCMAATQEFPNNILDFAVRYFTRILKKRSALRKYSIELSDQALFSDLNWSGNI